MPLRKIESREPVTQDAVAEKTYPDVQMTGITVNMRKGKLSGHAVFNPSDHSTGEIHPRPSFSVMLDDFDNLLSISPRLAKAWEDLNDVIGDAYEVEWLTQQIQKEDTPELQAELATAMGAFTAAVR